MQAPVRAEVPKPTTEVRVIRSDMEAIDVVSRLAGEFRLAARSRASATHR
jgi:hypothetical protein